MSLVPLSSTALCPGRHHSPRPKTPKSSFPSPSFSSADCRRGPSAPQFVAVIVHCCFVVPCSSQFVPRVAWRTPSICRESETSEPRVQSSISLFASLLPDSSASPGMLLTALPH